MHETDRRAVFLDRDGTVARYTEYCCRPENFHLLPGVGEAIRRLNEAGLFVMVVTNQSAIARRWLSWGELEQIHQKMRQQLVHAGAKIDSIYVCPHHPDDGCACRKPGIAMFQRAAKDFELSLTSSYVVGDRMLDVLSGRAVGGKAILVRSGHKPEPATHGVEPDYEAQDLTEAVAWILRQEGFRTGPGRRLGAAREARASGGAVMATETRAETPQWLERYAALTELMYEVRRLCPQLPVLGLSTVHPRHAVPPDHLRLMEAAPLALPSLWDLARRWVRCVLFAVRESLGLLWAKSQVWRDLWRLTREPATVILKTWGFGPDALHQTEDFYYGTLPQQLEARGIRCLLLCGDTRERFDATFTKALLRRPAVRTVPEQLLVPVWAPLVTVVRQFATALALRRLAKRAEQPSLARVAAAACLDSLQPITMRNILHCYLARKAVKTWSAKVFVTLYEGQPWEKPAWHGAKAADATCLTVGYQHTVIMPHSLSLLSPNRNSWERSTPDVVLCLGEIPLQMMAPGHQPFGSRLVCFGTLRRRGNQSSVAHSPQPKRRTVLVVPETGVIREAQRLFNFAMQAAPGMPDHRFIFRCHPAMPFPRLRPYLAGEPSAIPNIELSDGRPLSEDFARSSVVLYRGSSTVLYAVLHGLKPIYLQDANYPDVDPLFEVTGWRERVDSPEAMSDALQRYLTIDEAQAVRAWRSTAEYVKTYTQAVDAAAIDRFLHAIGLPGAAAVG